MEIGAVSAPIDVSSAKDPREFCLIDEKSEKLPKLPARCLSMNGVRSDLSDILVLEHYVRAHDTTRICFERNLILSQVCIPEIVHGDVVRVVTTIRFGRVPVFS